MSKPTKHYGKWRIRWIDEHGQRQGAVVDELRTTPPHDRRDARRKT